jgi:NADPH-dependent 2,4-dienoyl-CoA reductase/sulfur reductase-like enzyme
MTMRTLQDVRSVHGPSAAAALAHAVVIGGGPLALEWAHGLSIRGAKVTMLIRETRFLPGSLDAVASDLLYARLRQGGVDVRMGESVAAAMPGRDGRVAAVRTSSGQTIQTQLIAAAIGVTCNTEFLQNSVQLSPQRAVIVDDRLRTSAPTSRPPETSRRCVVVCCSFGSPPACRVASQHAT